MAKLYLNNNVTSVIFFKIVYENIKTKKLYPLLQHNNFKSEIHSSNTIKTPDNHNSIILEKNCFHLYTNIDSAKEFLNISFNSDYYKQQYFVIQKLISCKVNVQDILSFGFGHEVAVKKYQILKILKN